MARASDAGGLIACPCGRSIVVPSLSKLRMMAGADAYTTNPVEAIRRAQHLGISPPSDKCLLCGISADVVYQCHVVCESSQVKRAGNDQSDLGVLRWLLLPAVFNLLLAFRPREPECLRQGHDIEVDFILPLCNLCAASSGNVSRSRVAMRIMSNVPLYKELLTYYPHLKLKSERAVS